MCSRSSGYSNAAYCSMYDHDGDLDDQEGFFLQPCDNETFVDEMYEQEPRSPPLGASGSIRVDSRCSTPSSTPRKSQHRPRRQRSFSAPRNQNTMNVLAPMIAQARCNQREVPSIRRSKSAVFTKDHDDRRMSLGEPRNELAVQRGHPSRRTISVGQSQYRVTPVPRALDAATSYYDLSSSFSPPPTQRLRQCLVPERKGAALAVIPPSTRPLLPPPSPPHTLHHPDKTWASPPRAHRGPHASNTLWLSGLFLLFTSTVNCLLCFYLLAKLGLQKGRYYYIDFAVISGFAMLVLGFIGIRIGRLDWVLNRNYLAGYMVLSMLDVVLCGVLGLLASDWRPSDWPELVEVVSGAVCGLSAIMLLLALCLGASTCCKHPPPDNRVAHSVPSFIV